jgi:spore maturation protein CgeB
MKWVIFGLAISSSWGNGHATIWRGLVGALARRGHRVVFFEHDVPYYSAHRDWTEIPGGKLVLYSSWSEASALARRELADADAAILTSFCPDGIAATQAVLDSPAVRVFYDLDTPVTLAALDAGRPLSSIGPRGLRDFDLVLSYTGGEALKRLRDQLGAPRVIPLYGCMDPALHRPVAPVEAYRSTLSYLGTYAEDRMQALQTLFLEPARLLPEARFLIGGSLYPREFPWEKNIFFINHVPPPEHPAFYCSSRLTLNVTRGTMASMGFCPSGRLFEAASCGAPILSDWWVGLDRFFVPDEEILIASTPQETLHALALSDAELSRIARAAQERALEEHTAECRTRTLLGAVETAKNFSEAANV